MKEKGIFFIFFRTQIYECWHHLFGTTRWPPWICGIFLAILSLFMFLWWFVWGIAGGYKLWGDWFYYLLGVFKTRPKALPWLHGYSLSNFGIITGSLCASLFSRQFKVNSAPLWEYFKGFTGGIFMGIGAAISYGCNVGGFYSAIGMLDLGGIIMMFGLFLGSYLGLKYLIWELEHINIKLKNIPETKILHNSRISNFLGFFIFVSVIFIFWFFSKIDKTQMGGVFFLGFLIGILMQRGRFCFANAFREPFMTGDSTMMRAVLLSLSIYISGVIIIKWSYIQPPKAWIFHPYMGSFIGGVIFGFGMLLSGGCASGILWRIGEGHIKLCFAFIGFMLSHPLIHKLIKVVNIKKYLGKGIFLPSILGWPATLVFLMMLFYILYVVLKWNDEEKKLVI